MKTKLMLLIAVAALVSCFRTDTGLSGQKVPYYQNFSEYVVLLSIQIRHPVAEFPDSLSFCYTQKISKGDVAPDLALDEHHNYPAWAHTYDKEGPFIENDLSRNTIALRFYSHPERCISFNGSELAALDPRHWSVYREGEVMYNYGSVEIARRYYYDINSDLYARATPEACVNLRDSCFLDYYFYSNHSAVPMQIEKYQAGTKSDSLLFDIGEAWYVTSNHPRYCPFLAGNVDSSMVLMRFMADIPVCMPLPCDLSLNHPYVKRLTGYRFDIEPEVLSQATPEACVVE